MAEQVVELAPGESKQVNFEAIPHEAKTYQVSVNGLTGSFKAVGVAKFYMPPVMTVKVTDGSILGMYWGCKFSVVITNNGDAPGTYTLRGQDNLASKWDGPRTWGPKQITLALGQTYKWSVFYYIDFRRVSAPYAWELWGDWEQDNYSRGEARP